MLVVHNISLPPGEFGSGLVERFFCNCLDTSADPALSSICDLRVSAHLLIDRQGAISQFVPFHLRAWHAGVSTYAGRDNCNDFSIGVELEGTDTSGYSDNQYSALIGVAGLLMSEYPALSADRIVGHSDIAPGRKTDPGPGFDWLRFCEGLTRGRQQ